MLPKSDAVTLIIIPAWNEETTVASIIHRAAACMPDCDIVVVNDASSDRTADEAAAAGAHVLSLAVNLGAWGAIQTGLRFAARHGYEQVITMDADGQHLPNSLPNLLNVMERDRCDVVIGSCTQRGSRARKIAWKFFRTLTVLSVRDLTSGLRAYNRRAITLLASSQATLFEHQDIGVLLLLRRAGLTIHEVDVEMCPRLAGYSRVFSSWLRVAEYLLLTFVLCLSHGPGRINDNPWAEEDF